MLSEIKSDTILGDFIVHIIFWANNKLKTIADLQGKITELRNENKANNKSITDTVDRIEKLEKAIAYGETVLKHKNIVAEYAKKYFSKRSIIKNIKLKSNNIIISKNKLKNY